MGLIVVWPGARCTRRHLGAWRTETFRNRPVVAPFRREVSHWVENRMRGRMVLACLRDFASERSDMKFHKPKNTGRNHHLVGYSHAEAQRTRRFVPAERSTRMAPVDGKNFSLDLFGTNFVPGERDDVLRGSTKKHEKQEDEVPLPFRFPRCSAS